MNRSWVFFKPQDMKSLIKSIYFNASIQILVWGGIFLLYALPNSSWNDWTGWQRGLMLIEYFGLIFGLNVLSLIPSYLIQLKKYFPAILSIVAIFIVISSLTSLSGRYLSKQILPVEGEDYYQIHFSHKNWFENVERRIYFVVFLLNIVVHTKIRTKARRWYYTFGRLKHLDLILFGIFWSFALLREISHPGITGLLLVMTFVKIILSGIGFYLNAFVFIQRFLNKGKIRKYALYVLFSFLLIFVGKFLFRFPHFIELTNWEEKLDYFLKYSFIIDISACAVLIVIAVVFRFLYDSIIEYFTSSQQTKAELAGLKAQINPHFLFNTLNLLYSSALQEKSPKTAQGISQLSDMMRYAVYETREKQVSLKQEIAFIKSYVTLQKKRIAKDPDIKITVQLQEQEEIPELLVAPMLFIPFIENAFKHGVSYKYPSFIEIRMCSDDNSIHLITKNSKHPDQLTKDQLNTGVGLENTSKRLMLLYPENHSLEIEEKESEYSVKLSLLDLDHKPTNSSHAIRQ
ncbi:histidine kinase [Fulvivirgaceae bacterium BMA10]|uniref:Histidine kinase n=1 Tax=Splendidivirga corallicola TaxID=3051826 RepID=A0ABT8KJU8_9BACT|nr:histidine kinase [Fulvivirgaceae bacterium BMA10]